jgi:hypothetical protein
MATTVTVAEAARLLGRSAEATRKMINRHGVEKLYGVNRYTFRVRTADVLRAARRRSKA